jgi:hypothetical protein
MVLASQVIPRMRIDPKFAGLPVPTTANQRNVSGQRFSLDAKTGAGEAKKAASAAPLVTMDALLAVQGQEDDRPERRRRSLRRGHELLDGLDRLKAALLSGQVAAGELQNLVSQLAAQRQASGDAGLDEVVAHIELRAQVELAKLGRHRP